MIKICKQSGIENDQFPTPEEDHWAKLLNHKFKKRNYISKCGTH